ncbi:MAG: hypothetical protein P1U77_10095 [Rubripirellula sp.]|nr:hypothetical protein [Rubripirellula sp.]
MANVAENPLEPADENPYVPAAENMTTPAKESWFRQLLGILTISAAALFFFVIVFVGPFAWILRDGLGPSATESTASNAIAQTFWTFYFGPAALTTALVAAVAALMRYFLAKPPQ